MKPLWTRAGWSAFSLWHARRARRLAFADPGTIAAVQERRVRAIVRHAYESVPHYREAMDGAGLRPRDLRAATDLCALPMISSRDVAADHERFRSGRTRSDAVLEVRSSGTSGRAGRFTHDARSLFLVLAAGQRQREVLAGVVGRSLGYRELSVQREGGVSAQMRAFYEERSLVPAKLEIARADVSSAASFEEIADAVDAFRPDVLRGYGSQLGAFYGWLEASGRDAFRPRIVAYGGDGMTERDRRRIETRFATPVWSAYQSSEALRIAYQCERRDRFHVALDHVALRVVDAAGRTLGPGERGDVVISNLVNRATVLLNYRLGDVVTLSADPCPCGRGLPTIERIDGRSDDCIAVSRGSPIHALSLLGPLLQRLPEVDRLQVVQEEMRRFTVHVVGGGRAEASWQEQGARIEHTVREILGSDVAVDVRRAEAIAPEPSGKVRTLVSRVR